MWQTDASSNFRMRAKLRAEDELVQQIQNHWQQSIRLCEMEGRRRTNLAKSRVDCAVQIGRRQRRWGSRVLPQHHIVVQ